LTEKEDRTLGGDDNKKDDNNDNDDDKIDIDIAKIYEVIYKNFFRI